MPTHFKGTESEIRALNTFIKLMRATESMGARLSNILQSEGLTTSQFGVLEALYHLGPLNQRAISAKILKSGGNITTVIDNLEKRDLVTRERCPEDRRVVYANLTATGKTLIAKYLPLHVKEIEREMNILTPQEQEELGRLCKKLGLGNNTD